MANSTKLDRQLLMPGCFPAYGAGGIRTLPGFTIFPGGMDTHTLPASALGDRDWSELPLAALTWLFAKLGTVDILMGAGLVCQSWLEAAKSPCLWREVDMSHMDEFVDKDAGIMCAVAKVALERSDGRLEAFVGEDFVSDDLLKYIGERSPSLKRLGLISCLDVSNEGFAELLTRCPLLEDLTVMGCDNIMGEAYMVAATACPQLRRLELHKLSYSDDTLSSSSSAAMWSFLSGIVKFTDALGIASMRGLRELTLADCNITAEELEAVVDGCPHLEHLRTIDCRNLQVDDALRAKCARIKTLELPPPVLSYSDSDDQGSFYVLTDSDEY